jgi:hypothetical protein
VPNDLATEFVDYVVTLRNASLQVDLDSTTEVALDLADVRVAVLSDDDLTTAYWLYLNL